ncbi:MAG: VCBS repeat-containing protein, partial [Myxococcota bacterium]
MILRLLLLLGFGLWGMLSFDSALWASTCPIERQCAGQCCAVQEVCFQSKCVSRGNLCQKDQECAQDHFCSTRLNQCLAKVPLVQQCTYVPPIGQYTPEVLWSWSGSSNAPDFRNVAMTPVVMALKDTDKDGKIDHRDMPVVIFSSHKGGGSLAEEGILRAVRGDNGQSIFDVTDPQYRVNSVGSLAVGDINGDGKPEIIAPRFTQKREPNTGVYAFDHTGKWLWTSNDGQGKIATFPVGWGGASLADLDGDGNVEVVVGNVILNGKDGVVRCTAKIASNGSQGRSPVSVVADVDGDGKQEIIAGNALFRDDCSVVWQKSNLKDGYPAIADLNNDGTPEIVVVALDEVRVHDVRNGDVLFSSGINGGGGGPPTLGDFDKDGALEIATAARDFYHIFKPDFGLKRLRLLWQSATRDLSSFRTGSSIFDFEGDGRAEAIYGDEFFMRVFNGANGRVLFSVSNPSITTLEYPTIVDVNNDGRAELLVPSSKDPKIPGLRIFYDKLDNWVGTRNVWNQHAYSVTNVCTGNGDPFCPAGSRFGQIPAKPLLSWKTTKTNAFRKNVQGMPDFDAGDAVLRDLRMLCSPTPGKWLVAAWLFNQGKRVLPRQLPITFYQRSSTGQRTKVTTIFTDRTVLPGQGLYINTNVYLAASGAQPLVMVVNDDGTGNKVRNECNLQNNSIEAKFPNEAKELCDARDNDCDGKTDEDFPLGQACVVGQGSCQNTGQNVCRKDLQGFECSVKPSMPSPETCDGKDNDCDGKTDEELVRTCQSACGPGLSFCQNQQWTQCSGDKPKAEECNRRDDDCDGKTDESLQRACQTSCDRGQQSCRSGTWEECSARKPEPEDCNGKDDDCDGKTDESIQA